MMDPDANDFNEEVFKSFFGDQVPIEFLQMGAQIPLQLLQISNKEKEEIKSEDKKEEIKSEDEKEEIKIENDKKGDEKVETKTGDDKETLIIFKKKNDKYKIGVLFSNSRIDFINSCDFDSLSIAEKVFNVLTKELKGKGLTFEKNWVIHEENNSTIVHPLCGESFYFPGLIIDNKEVNPKIQFKTDDLNTCLKDCVKVAKDGHYRFSNQIIQGRKEGSEKKFPKADIFAPTIQLLNSGFLSRYTVFMKDYNNRMKPKIAIIDIKTGIVGTMDIIVHSESENEKNIIKEVSEISKAPYMEDWVLYKSKLYQSVYMAKELNNSKFEYYPIVKNPEYEGVEESFKELKTDNPSDCVKHCIDVAKKKNINFHNLIITQ